MLKVVKYQLKMTEPNYNNEYKCGAQANIDWVAGGNFTRYVFNKSILFKKENKQVIIKKHIINHGTNDGQLPDSETIGIYEFTDKDTITVKCNDFTMRGKILGKEKVLIAFSVYHPQLKCEVSEVYQLVQ